MKLAKPAVPGLINVGRRGVDKPLFVVKPVDAERIQIAIGNARYAGALREALLRNGAAQVNLVEVPDPRREDVMVLDTEHLERLPSALANPERIVLIARNDPGCLARAWEIGVTSVVFEKDPLNTAVLAVMSAGLRKSKTKRDTVPEGSRDSRLKGK